VLGRGGDGAGEQARRRPVNAAAAAIVPGVLGALGSGRQAGELRFGRRKVEEVLEVHAAGRKGKLTAAAWPARRRVAGSTVGRTCASLLGAAAPLWWVARAVDRQGSAGSTTGTTAGRRKDVRRRDVLGRGQGSADSAVFPAFEASEGEP
jgi:hypothetical protein